MHTAPNPLPPTLSQGFLELALPSPSNCILFQPKLPAAPDSQITVHREMIAIGSLSPPTQSPPAHIRLMLSEMLRPLWANYTPKEPLKQCTDVEANVLAAKEFVSHNVEMKT